jgi:hypothetical protein
VLFGNDIARNRQSLPGSLSYFLGSEEWIKNPGLNGGGNTDAVILDSNLDKFAILASRDGNPAETVSPFCFSDGMGGIDDQVQNDLFQFPRQATDRRKSRV